MKQNEQLYEILQLVLSRRLGQAVYSLENYLLSHPRQHDQEQFNGIRDAYQLMNDYWQRGYADPERGKVFDQLLRRLFVLTSNLLIHSELTDSAFLRTLHQRPRKVRQDWSMSAVRASLESFVSDVTLLELEPAATRQSHGDALYARHRELMRDLFDYIVTSHQWRTNLADAFLDMLLSPTLASIDQQLVVSAITLSAVQHFCFQKFRVLSEVYRQSTDEAVRQRALVGWVLTLGIDCPLGNLFTELGDQLSSLLSDARTAAELAELQMQLVYCQQADADRDTIQKEILPDIMSGSKLKMNGGSLVEDDNDSLDDILHPEASEQAIERMEQSMQRMVEMQKQGADIYFGGFSQMKRFPFFNDLSNWFVPFYPQHPDISSTWQKTRASKFLKTITRVGAFCDSDKYSFVLAFNQVLDRLPANILKMVEQGEATAMPIGGEVAIGDQQEPAFIRRVYLQDLYRFYRLFPARSEFCNPFAEAFRFLFFANPLFSLPSLGQQGVAIARFLMKRHRYDDAKRVLVNVSSDCRDLHYHLLMGATLQHLPEDSCFSAADSFQQALLLQPDNERALSGLARSLFASEHYEAALKHYTRLLELKPDDRSYQLNAAVCQLSIGQSEEALKLLYKLSYLHPDDIAVSRVMAWTLTRTGKYEQADKHYCQLLALEHPEATDMLNYGYCLWLKGDISTAIGMFRQFLSSRGDEPFDLSREFMHTEHRLLADHGISDDEIQLMTDAATL